MKRCLTTYSAKQQLELRLDSIDRSGRQDTTFSEGIHWINGRVYSRRLDRPTQELPFLKGSDADTLRHGNPILNNALQSQSQLDSLAIRSLKDTAILRPVLPSAYMGKNVTQECTIDSKKSCRTWKPVRSGNRRKH